MGRKRTAQPSGNAQGKAARTSTPESPPGLVDGEAADEAAGDIVGNLLLESIPELPLSCCSAHTSQDAVLRLEQLGFTVLPGLLSPSDCDAIRALVDSARGKASDDDYTRIHNPRLRKDLPLRLHPFNGALATLFSARGGLLKAVLDEAVRPTARLVEFAAMTILPGAPAQPVHQDVHQATIVEAENARYITVFVSLCDVPEVQGPMELWAGTHRLYIPWEEAPPADDDCACSESEDGDEKSEAIDESSARRADVGEHTYVQGATAGEPPSGLAALTLAHMRRGLGRVRLTVRKGDVYLVDPRARKTAPPPRNRCSTSREGKRRLLGSTDSMLEEYKGKFSLHDICEAVASFPKRS
ncbi:hypothetical protein T484DRAFT_1765473 [Baffinella frigidus]|nr:hypothetical protein T484DRAFT_1765473 [Cryptophyta sp. CCMP2293]